MNKNFYAVYDLETGGKNKYKSQPIEIACLIIDKNLKPVKGGFFESLIKPYDDDQAIKLGLEPIQDEALKVNNKTREELIKAPEPKIVWKKFVDFLSNYKTENSSWGNPVRVGYNINNFDDQFVHRLCCEEPYKFGPSNEYGSDVFHPIHSIDVMSILNSWVSTSYIPELKSLSMDNLRKFFGMSSELAHTAGQDIIDTGELFIRFMKMHKEFIKRGIKFKDSCKDRFLSIDNFR